MTLTRVGFWKSFVFFNFILILVSSPAVWGQARPRVVQLADNEQRVTLKGNVHPMATTQNDRGPFDDAQPIGRILLLLKRGGDQQAALSSIMEQQQDKSSPHYHQWLAPADFGAQYGVADEDIQAVTQWLTQQGFQINQVYSSKLEIEFSGTAAQVRSAFGTELRNFQVGGKTYVANSADPQIPAALAPVIAGIVSLNNFPRQSHARDVGQFRRQKGQSFAKPLFTFPQPFGQGIFYGLGPGDFAAIYNSAPLIAAANDGTGQTIAIVGETNINLQDVQNFRQMFGLPSTFTAANLILNGADPGITSTGEETEADLDVQWSGAVAPGATVKFVVSASTPVSAGIDLSALYIIEHNLAGVMSESYGACEGVLGSAGNAFYNSLWEQAAAQGITVVLSSGDGGTAGCDDFNTESAATGGLAISGLSSTAFNVSAGGTDFDQMNQLSTYWNPTNDPTTGTSVKGYIPEIPWNENCAQFGLTGCVTNTQGQYQNIVAGSGGPSTKYSKPAWQLGVTGMPNDSKRDQPDISLFASPGFNGTGYIVCQEDRNLSGTPSCDLNASGGLLDFEIIGGTSASAPAFAGVMALVNQYEAAHGGSPRQGNANYTLYALAKKAGASCNSIVGEAAGCVFNDVTHGNTGFTGSVGTNSVPCQAGTTNCSVKTGGTIGVLVDVTNKEAWGSTAGYDMTTGLGTVNVQNLAQNWGSVSTIATTTTLALTPSTGITHGTAENVGVSITVKPVSGTATGDVSLIANLPGSTQGLDGFTLASGAVTGAKTQSLPGGTYQVTAHYAGDGTSAPSDSAPVSVTVAQETSQTFIVIPTFDSTGVQISGNANTVTYGGSYIIRMYITDKTGVANPAGAPRSTCDQINPLTCPMGSVALAGNGTPIDAGTFNLNSAGYTRDIAPTLQGGSYSLAATYSGDSSYSGSNSGPRTFTVTPAATQLSGPFIGGPNPTLIGSPVAISAQMTSSVFSGAAPSGTVTFFDGSAALPGSVTLTASAGTGTGAAMLNASLTATFSVTGAHTITAKYSGDANFAASNSAVTAQSAVNSTTIAQTEDSTSVTYGQPITVTAKVVSTSKSPAMTGSVLFYMTSAAGPPLPGNTTVAGTDTNGNQILTSTITFTPQGTGVVNVLYQGDANYSGAQTGGDFINVSIPDFSLSQNVSVTVTAGQTSTASLVVTPVTNVPSPVVLSLNNSQPFPGATVTLIPTMVTLNGSPVPVMISVTTSAPSAGSQAVRHMQLKRAGFLVFSRAGWWSTAGASAALLVFLLGYPKRKRRYRAAFLAGLVCAISFAMGCGGGGSSGGGGGGGIVKVASTTTISSPATKVAAGAPFTLNATVTSSKATTGTVSFFLAGQPFDSPVPVVNGQATLTPPEVFGMGIYSFTAVYSGDVNNLSSQSASSGLSIAFTGSTSMGIAAQTGTLQHGTLVNITLQ